MVEVRRSAALLAALLAVAVPGQDPAVDLPARRPPALGDAQCLEFGLQRLEAGWDWEAARLFRELLTRDVAPVTARLGLALALRQPPERALGWCREVLDSAAGSSSERRLVEVYARWFTRCASGYVGGTDPLLDELAALAAGDDVDPLTSRLLAHERNTTRGGVPPGELEAVLECHNVWLRRTGAMPFQVPCYRILLRRALEGRADRDLQLARVPRHPRYGWVTDAEVGPLPGFDAEGGALLWEPRLAPGFDLPRGLGGRGRAEDHAGRPLLVVFFLGFGCEHCVAQLQGLDPLAHRFRDAGIGVVTIGTDDRNRVRAAWLSAQENDVDPLHLDVLCDPEGETFRRWGCWDQFADEALHGTFLVDAKGRILWQDISARPFEQTEFLLEECRRLLEAWK